MSLSETYSDNILLSVDQKEHESITEITPGFSLSGQGARLKLGADYSMQNIFYANDSSRNKTSHQLAAYEQSELISDLFYFDARTSISQQLTSISDQLSFDNLNPVGNRDDVVTLQVEPYLRHDLGSYASTEVRYSHGWVNYDGGAASDTESSVISAYLADGYGATNLHWRVGYRQQNDMRDTGSDSERRSTDGMIRYSVIRTLSLVGYAGREDNDIQTSTSSVNGTYWSAGFNWIPGPKFSLEVTTGDNYDQGRLTWNPIKRTSVNISYSDMDVGLNTSATWSGRISHRTRRSTWALDYSEVVTNVQVLALQERIPVGIVFDPETGLFDVEFVNVFALTDEEFLRARGQGSVNYRTGKSTVTLVVFSESRTYEISGDELSSNGGNASWRWRFASRTSSLVSLNAQRFETLGSTEERQSMTSRFSLRHTLSSKTSARLEVSHLVADSISSDQEYIENRISAHLNMTF